MENLYKLINLLKKINYINNFLYLHNVIIDENYTMIFLISVIKMND